MSSSYREHQIEVGRESARNASEKHNNEFSQWFHERVFKQKAAGCANEDLVSLAIGPAKLVHRYGTYIVNGYKFHTRDRAAGRKTQNSGVLVKGDDQSEEKEYFGVLEDILELSYVGDKKIILFKCHWYDVGHLGRGYKIDSFGYTCLNKHRSLSTNEPFVLAMQAEQVFYVEDLTNIDWIVVVKTIPRDLYNMPRCDTHDDDGGDSDGMRDDEDAFQQEEARTDFDTIQAIDNELLIDVIVREDILPESFNVKKGAMESTSRGVDHFINDGDLYQDIDDESDEDTGIEPERTLINGSDSDD